MFFQNGRAVNAEPEYIRSCIEKSLGRLGVEYIDLYYLHRPDPTVPIEKAVQVMAEFVKYVRCLRYSFPSSTFELAQGGKD